MDDARELKAALDWAMLDLVTAPAPDYKRVKILECTKKINFIKLLRILSSSNINDYKTYVGLKEAVDFFHAANLSHQPLPKWLDGKAEELAQEAMKDGVVLSWE